MRHHCSYGMTSQPDWRQSGLCSGCAHASRHQICAFFVLLLADAAVEMLSTLEYLSPLPMMVVCALSGLATTLWANPVPICSKSKGLLPCTACAGPAAASIHRLTKDLLERNDTSNEPPEPVASDWRGSTILSFRK